MRVSIGIPFYNAEATLADAIRSVFAQTFDDWELILVNDGSRDGSLRIARSVRDPRVKLIDDGRNRGLVARLNQIAQIAAGEYIARMDSDDIMHPDRLRRQVSILDRKPSVDLVSTAAYVLGGSGVYDLCGLPLYELAPIAALARRWVVHPTVTGRAEWFRANPYDARFVRAEDHELWCRTAARTVLEQIREPLLYYRDGSSIDSRSYLKKYLLSCRTDCSIYRRYGPPLLGWAHTAALMAGSAAKASVYTAFTLMGIESRLQQRGATLLSPAEREASMLLLREILAAPVPGMTGPVGPEPAFSMEVSKLMESVRS